MSNKKPTVLSFAVKSKTALHACFIPWMRGTALFMPAAPILNLGDPVLVLISLLDEPTRIPAAGKVAWVSPANVHGNRPPGIGVRFDDDPAMKDLRARIEQVLGTSVQSSKSTHTL
jgi:type IV pilus assembly protein PilZ